MQQPNKAYIVLFPVPLSQAEPIRAGFWHPLPVQILAPLLQAQVFAPLLQVQVLPSLRMDQVSHVYKSAHGLIKTVRDFILPIPLWYQED